MAGTLTISTLSDGTNSTSATNCIQGSAKAWVNFNGSTATIRSSYNVSSITKGGTGNYTVNITNAISDANYCATLAIAEAVGTAGDAFGIVAQTTTTLQVSSTRYGSGSIDVGTYCVSIFR